MSDHPIADILRDPVTLAPIESPGIRAGGYLDLRPGQRSAKNVGELEFTLNDYTEPDGSNYVQRLPHMVHPDLGDTDIVIDVGCGPRDFLGGLGGHHVFVDDILGDYVERAGAVYDGLAIQARTELLPFADASVDVVYSVNMIDHVDDMAGSIAELARILRPGGQVVLQTYFNSHPLLLTEPGVFDRFFFDHYVLPLFEARDVRTHCVQSPTISDYYTMGILTTTLVRRNQVEPPERDRRRIADETGPQSLISEVLEAIQHEDHHRAEELLARLERTGLQEFHGQLLDAKLAIATGNLGQANDGIGRARRHPRAHRNPYARLAIQELEGERLRAAARTSSERLELARERHAGAVTEHTERLEQATSTINDLEGSLEQRSARVVELEQVLQRRNERIEALEAGFERRAERILQLTEAVSVREARATELKAATVRRDARISELDGAIAQRDRRISELDDAITGRDRRIRDLAYRHTNPTAGDLVRNVARLPRRVLRKVTRRAMSTVPRSSSR